MRVSPSVVIYLYANDDCLIQMSYRDAGLLTQTPYFMVILTIEISAHYIIKYFDI